MYDLIIVGGGPAGSIFAKFIGNKFKTLVIEKRNFNEKCRSESKCCGGLIAPDAQKMLAAFNMGLPGSVMMSPQLFSVRTIDFDNNLERFYQRHYINIDREKFDLWLYDQIPSTVEKRTGCIYKSHEIIDDHVKVTFDSDGRLQQAEGKYLVGADGALSRVRRNAFPNSPMPKRYVSIQQWFENKTAGNYYGAIFDKEITDFYSWTIPKGDMLILGSAINADCNIWERFNKLKTKIREYGYDLGKPFFTNGAHIMRPTRLNQVITGSERVLLIGEAAGLISPSSAEGLSYCFKSALSLANAFKNLDGVDVCYKRNVNSLKRNILIKNMKSPGMYNSFLRKFAMKSGIMSIKMEDGFITK